MAIEASLAKELSGFQDSDHCLLALFGDNKNLDPSLLNIKNRIRDVSLRKDDLVLVKLQYGFALTDLGEKEFWIKQGFRFWHEVVRAWWETVSLAGPAPAALGKFRPLTNLLEIRGNQLVAALPGPRMHVCGRLENQVAMCIERTDKTFFVTPKKWFHIRQRIDGDKERIFDRGIISPKAYRLPGSDIASAVIRK